MRLREDGGGDMEEMERSVSPFSEIFTGCVPGREIGGLYDSPAMLKRVTDEVFNADRGLPHLLAILRP